MHKKMKSPDVFSQIYWLIEDDKIESNNLLKFLDCFWPEFLLKDGCVFLKETFNEEEYLFLLKEGESPEYWMNLCVFDEFFMKDEKGEEKALEFVRKLAELWETKLRLNFPKMDFVVQSLWNKEFGDVGITFYQGQKDQLLEYEEIRFPNVREQIMIQLPNHSRPSISQIRKPKPEEIPKKPLIHPNPT